MAFGRLHSNSRATGIVMVMSAGVLWSTIGIGVRAMESATSYQVVFHRATGQVPFVLAVLAVRYRRSVLRAFRAIGWTGVIGAVCLALAYLTGVYAVANTTVANAVFAFSTAPIFAAGLGWLLLREPVKRMTGVSVALGLVGITVLTWGQGDAGQLAGNVAGVAAAVSYAGFAVSLGKKKHVDMLPMIAVSGVVAALLAAAVSGGDVVIDRSDQILGFLLGAGALGLGLMLFTAGSKHLTTAELPILAMTETILAPIWVWVLIGEAMTFQSILGGSILLAAVLLQSAQFDERRAARVRPTGAIADAAAAIHVWLASDDGRSDPFGPAADVDPRQLYPPIGATPQARPATWPVVETGTPAGGWGTMWHESAEGWVQSEDGQVVWRPIVTTAALVSGWEIESYVGVVSGDAWVADGNLSSAREEALAKAIDAATARGAHALIGVGFDTPRIGSDRMVSATATGVTLRSK